MNGVPAILDEINRNAGVAGVASERLLPLVYEELRRLAAARMSREAGVQTLQPTALVHEVWLRLERSGQISWENEGHFFGAAARAMRRILVERARSSDAMRRKSRDDLPEMEGGLNAEPGGRILMIHEALKRLEKEDPDAANVVLLKFYSGLGNEEIARMSGRSVRSVERRWTLAKARLYKMIRADGGGGNLLPE
ncbi:MAG: polymerase subunit sigma-24 [Akkermansiaceae bacterium]|nr:polymerase subunit sigma-24 [Akkermansiaceae bacterium]